MTDPSKSSRRDFLKGRSAVQTLRQTASSIDREASFPSPEAVDRQNSYLEHFSKNAMACEFALLFNMQQYPQSGSVTSEAFQLIDELEDQLSVYRELSEVSMINRTAFNDFIDVERGLYRLLALANVINRETGGAFDITAGPLSKIWGFDQRDGRLPDKEGLEAALHSVGMQFLLFDDEALRIKFETMGLTINLGGIGKGYALDQVADLVQSKEVNDFVVNGGQSSVIARGSEKVDKSGSHSGWNVGLSHPTVPDTRLAVISLKDESLGTSGTGRQGFFVDGKRYGHIIDPRSGWPTDHFLSTTVISPSAALSDALATAFFVMSLEEVEAYCRDHTEVKTVCVSQSRSGQLALEWFNLDDEDWTRS